MMEKNIKSKAAAFAEALRDEGFVLEMRTPLPGMRIIRTSSMSDEEYRIRIERAKKKARYQALVLYTVPGIPIYTKDTKKEPIT